MPELSDGINDLLGAFKQLDTNSDEGVFVGPVEAANFQIGQSRTRGLAASKLIRKSDDVLRMPRDFIFTPEDANAARFRTMGPLAKLALSLAEARKTPSTKALAAYFASLPSITDYRQQGLPFTATDEDLATLAKLPRLRDIAKFVGGAREQLQAKLQAYNGNLEGASLPLKWDDIVWAGSTVMTRAFFCDGKLGSKSVFTPAMVPIADALNHSDDPNVDWDCQSEKMVMTALRDIQPGEELTDSYSEHASDPMNLFNRWGIITKASTGHWDAGDCETIRAAHLEQSDSSLLRGAHELASRHCAWGSDVAPNSLQAMETASKMACVSGLILLPPPGGLRNTRPNGKIRNFI